MSVNIFAEEFLLLLLQTAFEMLNQTQDQRYIILIQLTIFTQVINAYHIAFLLERKLCHWLFNCFCCFFLDLLIYFSQFGIEWLQVGIFCVLLFHIINFFFKIFLLLI